MINLTKRLSCVAEFAQDGTNIADIGTDHGYIPVYLALRGGYGKITASDVKEGPLSRARISAEEKNVGDRITFVLADGVSGIGPEYDTVIIAGMGGDTIVSILSEAKWDIRGTHFVLQPQSKISNLMTWLHENSFSVDDARLVRDGGKMYVVLSVRAGNTDYDLTILDRYIPRVLREKKDPLLVEYVTDMRRKTERALAGMEASDDRGDGRRGEYRELLDETGKLLEEMKI